MIELCISYDEKDVKIGEYCKYCKEKLNDYLSTNPDIVVHNFNSGISNHVYISTFLPSKSCNFIFVAYSHGSTTQLLCKGSVYIDEYNANLFKKSMVYAMACSAGAELGKTLIHNGCKVFIGFNKEVHSVEGYEKVSERCENWGIMSFLLSPEPITIGEAFKSMKNEFTNQIDRLGMFEASWLVGNRDALVLLGDKNITRSYF